jgi:Beta-lactamase
MNRADVRQTLSSDSRAVTGTRKRPGIQYVVVNRDATLYEHQHDWADIASGRSMSPGTTMMAYSMSKTITAAAVRNWSRQTRLVWTFLSIAISGLSPMDPRLRFASS